MLLEGYLPQIIAGAEITIGVSVCSILLGIVLGIVGALGEMNSIKLVQKISLNINSLIRGLPELLTIFIVYFIGTIIFSKIMGRYAEVSPFVSGVLALGIVFGSYATQVFRGAFLSIHKGQVESAVALGLPKRVVFRKILFPQALRYALPGLSNICLTTLKDSSLISLIGLHELTFKSQIAATETYKPFTFYLTCALIYLLFTSLSELLFKFLQHKTNYAKH